MDPTKLSPFHGAAPTGKPFLRAGVPKLQELIFDIHIQVANAFLGNPHGHDFREWNFG
jgi:hypothetical protein